MLPKKENIKCQFLFLNSGSNFRLVLALNEVDFEVLLNYNVLDFQVLFPWLQKSSQSDIEVKQYGQSTKTS